MSEFKFTQKANRERAKEIFDLLDNEYPDAECSLDHSNPLQLMIATILSAQCTDARVNKETPALFARFQCAEDYYEADVKEIEKFIQSCGFYRSKAKNIKKACTIIVEKHGGEVPRTLDELTELGGVGRKTANVILGTCFDTPGVVVDTHCGRLTRRMGFTKNTDPVKVEKDLMKIWEHKNWSLFSHFMVFHGRAVCPSRKPKCSQCNIKPLCPFPDTREGKKISE